MSEYINDMNKLFDIYVPPTGKSNTVIGELVRTVSRIWYRFYNDGDKINVGHGKEYCNSSYKYIKSVIKEYKNKDNRDIIKVINSDLGELWRIHNTINYEKKLDELVDDVYYYIELTPEIKTAVNTIDGVWDFN